jgi:ABC-type dipeptide/oligopeptide/nickel transport system permease component
MWRSCRAALTAAAAVVLNFFLFRALPGNASSSFGALPGASPELRAEISREFGLNSGVGVQLTRYVVALFHGNFGVSYTYREPVSALIFPAILNSLRLVVPATALAVALGIVAGMVSARWRGRLPDLTISGFSALTYSLPVMWIGLLLVWLLGPTFAAGGMNDPFMVKPTLSQHISGIIHYYTLPTLTLGLAIFGSFALVARAAIGETLSEDYILMARAKGLTISRILRRYALRNAVLPLTTQVAIQAGFLVGGATLVEVVFSWPGIGYDLYQAVLNRDYPVMQAGFLIITLSVIACVYVADVLNAVLDPRLRD